MLIQAAAGLKSWNKWLLCFVWASHLYSEQVVKKLSGQSRNKKTANSLGNEIVPGKKNLPATLICLRGYEEKLWYVNNLSCVAGHCRPAELLYNKSTFGRPLALFLWRKIVNFFFFLFSSFDNFSFSLASSSSLNSSRLEEQWTNATNERTNRPNFQYTDTERG